MGESDAAASRGSSEPHLIEYPLAVAVGHKLLVAQVYSKVQDGTLPGAEGAQSCKSAGRGEEKLPCHLLVRKVLQHTQG